MSVVTIVRGRGDWLAAQGRSLAASKHKPDEWVVVGMGEEPQPPHLDGIDVVTEQVDMDKGRLPLAAARNRGVQAASHATLVFLDVDCVAAPSLLGTLGSSVATINQIWMGVVCYLDPPPAGGYDYEDLDRHGKPHSVFPKLEPGEILISRPHRYFWSLCFATSRQIFEQIGGFDPCYRGYGAEDTDFAMQARYHRIGTGLVGDRAYHQYHDSYDPPLNHFDDIIRNAQTFHCKWGSWPMESWLERFASMGLVDFDPAGRGLRIIRRPTSEEITRARKCTKGSAAALISS